ncbi:MAG TPA: DUF4139 domain-containing protein, partial [Candidatus Bathyarchaeia archaeon]|nr:DUF4139 domain-containing protein [Candidatus Bathyarchaeia archaeon]
MRPLAWIALLLAPAVLAAETHQLPDSTAADRTSVAVTVYNQNLALVREVRNLEIDKSGIGTLRFMDVPSSINPRTVHLQSLASGGPHVFEQNYEFDLISPEKLMEKYVGKEVEIIEQAQDLTTRTVKATLLSTNGAPVYKIGDRIVIGQYGKVTLPDLPKDLVARPTLVWTVDAPKTGTTAAEASYLTDNMSWSADYVAVVDENDTKTGLSGWVTIDNRSGATFENATLKLVAGDVRRIQPDRLMAMEAAGMMRADMAAKAPSFQEEGFFEYHLYTLDRPSTIKNNQTKQLSLLTASNVPVMKKLLLTGNRYWYRGQVGTITQGEKVAVTLELTNSAANNLGMPLPKGTVRVYKKDKSGAQQFIGEDSIDHTPRDEKVRVKMGEAFDVVADKKQTAWTPLGDCSSESAWEISLRNHKDSAETIEIDEPAGGDW